MNKEREFLHDISSPLTAVQLNVESAVELLAEQNDPDLEDCRKILHTCLGQLKRAADMISRRRDTLLAAEKKR